MRKTSEWDQAVMQMPERTFEPTVHRQDPWGRTKKVKKANAFFDELLKISASLSGKGALVGGAIGAGIGTLKAVSREARERAWDDRAKLTDSEKKALRKKRLTGHAASVMNWSGAGAGLGTAHKLVGEAAGKMVGGITKNVQPHINQFTSNTLSHAAGEAKKHVDDIATHARSHIPKVVDEAATRAKGHVPSFASVLVDSVKKKLTGK